MPRRTEAYEAEKIGPVLFTHAAVTATTALKVYKVPANRSFRLTRAVYHNVTGLAADGTNAFAGTVQNGSTVAATLFNTDSGDAGGAALAADTFVEGSLSATDADRIFEAGEELSLVLTEDGTATLPAGTFTFEGYLF